MRFQDKVALITAAASGIGRASADIMAREGAIIVAVDNNEERLDRAVAAADADGVARSLLALRRAASPLGGTQLCELLASLQGLAASELRQLGASHVQRLDAEIKRLAAALTEIVAAAEARQR